MTCRLLIASLALTLGTLSGGDGASDPFSIGVNLYGHTGCPVFVWSVEHASPADLAGIVAGDRILAVSNVAVTDIGVASRLLQSEQAGTVAIELAHGDKNVRVEIQRERRSAIYRRAGKVVLSGAVVSPDTSPAEVEQMMNFDDHRLVGRVFMITHYPRTPGLFYGGFEMFLLRDPEQVMVGGIENGPAASAGLHWGDVVTSVNGIPVAGKDAATLEDLFSASQSKIINLTVNRLGNARNFRFSLEKAEEIARQNGKRYRAGEIVPSWATEKDMPCLR